MIMTTADQAIVQLGRALVQEGYRFTTITPESHRRVNARPENRIARDLAGVFGWSRPFEEGLLPENLLTLMRTADLLVAAPEGLHRSRVRFSTLGTQLYAHSSYPTEDRDAVFFGPDSYRFVALLRREVSSARRLIDLGAGAGVGALSLCDRVRETVLTDINAAALRFARINAEINGCQRDGRLELCQSNLLDQVKGTADLIIANPPYLSDERARTYRSGGALGHELSVRIVREALPRLEARGRLILYTASPVQHGKDLFRAELETILSPSADLRYEELDPDVFGEELERPAYRNIDRLALVSCIVTSGADGEIPGNR